MHHSAKSGGLLFARFCRWCANNCRLWPNRASEIYNDTERLQVVILFSGTIPKTFLFRDSIVQRINRRSMFPNFFVLR